MDSFVPLMKEAAEKCPGMCILENIQMRDYTTFKIGGPVRLMAFPEKIGQLEQFVQLCSCYGIQRLIIGNGSNLLISDREHDMAVINMCRMDKVEITGTTITAGAGAKLSKIAACAQKNGLSGFEFASGIPGTMGGAVIMNAGAYGGEIKDVAVSVDVLEGGLVIKSLSNIECGFGYRQSRFSGDDIILSAVIRLKHGEPEEIRQKMEELASRRREKQPTAMPSAGSTFKRPEKGYAAALIEESGLKGFAIGGARVSEKHAGFIVNTGGASFDDVLNLIDYVQKTVLSKTGVTLSPEVKIIR